MHKSRFFSDLLTVSTAWKLHQAGFVMEIQKGGVLKHLPRCFHIFQRIVDKMKYGIMDVAAIADWQAAVATTATT